VVEDYEVCWIVNILVNVLLIPSVERGTCVPGEKALRLAVLVCSDIVILFDRKEDSFPAAYDARFMIALFKGSFCLQEYLLSFSILKEVDRAYGREGNT